MQLTISLISSPSCLFVYYRKQRVIHRPAFLFLSSCSVEDCSLVNCYIMTRQLGILVNAARMEMCLWIERLDMKIDNLMVSSGIIRLWLLISEVCHSFNLFNM